MAVATDHPAEVSAPILIGLGGGGPQCPGAHQLVVHREERSLTAPLFGPCDVLPAAVREETVVRAGDQLGSVFEPDSVRGLSRTPVRQDPGSLVAAVRAAANGAV